MAFVKTERSIVSVPEHNDPGFSADTSWFHIFKELIRSGRWAQMSTAAAKLYPVIKAFINWENGHACPKVETLMEYSGMSRASVIKGLKELEEIGLLRRDNEMRQRGSYYLVERFEVKDGDGRPTASVSFDYLPAYIKDAVAELKRFVMNGSDKEGNIQIIHIENLNLQIVKDQATGNQENNVHIFKDKTGPGLKTRPRKPNDLV